MPCTVTYPIRGRYISRLLRGGTILAGVVHFEPDVRIREGAARLLVLRDDVFALGAHDLDDGVPEGAGYEGAGLGQLASCAVWQRQGGIGMFTVRFVSAFPESNGWSFVAVSPFPFETRQMDAAGHAWWDAHGGEVVPCVAPIDARGKAIGQLLTDHPIWPDAGGAPHSVPQLETRWREPMLEVQRLCSRVGRGELSPADCSALLRERPELKACAPGSIDLDYCRFLATVERDYGLELIASRTAEAHALRAAQLSQALDAALFQSA